MEMSPEINELAAALPKAQAGLGKLVASHTGEVKGKSKKSGSEYSYSYNYANLPDALDACLAPFNAEGITVLQSPASANNGVTVTTMLVHTSGQWMRSDPLFMPVAGGAQDVGSAITYARRYSLLAMVGLAPEDDDGASAQAAKPDSWGQRGPSPKRKTDAIGARCSGKGWAGKLGEEIDQLVKDLAAANGCEPGDVWWPLVEGANVDQQKYMDTDGAWPSQPSKLSTADGKAVKAVAAREFAEASRQHVEGDQ